MIAGTAAAWVEAVTFGREWVESRDRPRFRAAFVTLANTREQWPAPKHFIEAMPAAPSPLALVRDRRPADPEVTRKAVERITALLGDVVQPMPKARVEHETTAEQRERIEAELRQHYGKAGAL